MLRIPTLALSLLGTAMFVGVLLGVDDEEPLAAAPHRLEEEAEDEASHLRIHR